MRLATSTCIFPAHRQGGRTPLEESIKMCHECGFRVIDLGRDVPPEVIVDAVLQHKAPLCGLSALMTTTVPAMAETVALLAERAPVCRTVVGGAVLTPEAAAAMGAHHYAPDAMDGVRYAEEICK